MATLALPKFQPLLGLLAFALFSGPVAARAAEGGATAEVCREATMDGGCRLWLSDRISPLRWIRDGPHRVVDFRVQIDTGDPPTARNLRVRLAETSGVVSATRSEQWGAARSHWAVYEAEGDVDPVRSAGASWIVEEGRIVIELPRAGSVPTLIRLPKGEVPEREWQRQPFAEGVAWGAPPGAVPPSPRHRDGRFAAQWSWIDALGWVSVRPLACADEFWEVARRLDLRVRGEVAVLRAKDLERLEEAGLPACVDLEMPGGGVQYSHGDAVRTDVDLDRYIDAPLRGNGVGMAVPDYGFGVLVDAQGVRSDAPPGFVGAYCARMGQVLNPISESDCYFRYVQQGQNFHGMSSVWAMTGEDPGGGPGPPDVAVATGAWLYGVLLDPAEPCAGEWGMLGAEGHPLWTNTIHMVYSGIGCPSSSFYEGTHRPPTARLRRPWRSWRPRGWTSSPRPGMRGMSTSPGRSPTLPRRLPSPG